jgi:cytochrome c
MSISSEARGRFLRQAALATGVLALLSAGLARAETPSGYPGIGRPATPAEIRAWDIDVRKDFTGLPKGSGSVARGQVVWDEKCASCHGTFGESNEFFNPIVGGTTPADVKTGRVASLTTSELQRTTLMKLSSLATLWDYIRRAMPWTAPKSLSADDVYAVSAYILHLADLVPADFALSDANIRETDRMLPNRNGMTTAHGLWDVRGKPDVRNTACLKNCAADLSVQSSLPDYARNAHGNLALQNREIGGVRGVDTSVPREVALAAGHVVAPATAATGPLADASRAGCLGCHAVDRKVVGPAFRDIAGRYKVDGGHEQVIGELAHKILRGTSGGWGNLPMPPQAQVSAAGAELLARWIAAGAP